jgi:hypothetical protein
MTETHTALEGGHVCGDLDRRGTDRRALATIGLG